MAGSTAQHGFLGTSLMLNSEPCHHGAAQAKALAVNESNLQGELDGAVLALQERAALLDALNAKLTSVGDTLDAFEHELQARHHQDRTVRSCSSCGEKLPDPVMSQS